MRRPRPASTPDLWMLPFPFSSRTENRISEGGAPPPTRSGCTRGPTSTGARAPALCVQSGPAHRYTAEPPPVRCF